MTNSPRFRGPRTTVVGSFVHQGRHYEQRLVDCGKINCQRCGGSGDRHPSHGPYWYLCIARGKRWTRVYIGKDLDTTKFIAPNGSVDWSKVIHHKAKAPADSITSPDPPGQLDMLDPQPAPEPSADRQKQTQTGDTTP